MKCFYLMVLILLVGGLLDIARSPHECREVAQSTACLGFQAATQINRYSESVAIGVRQLEMVADTVEEKESEAFAEARVSVHLG